MLRLNIEMHDLAFEDEIDGSTYDYINGDLKISPFRPTRYKRIW